MTEPDGDAPTGESSLDAPTGRPDVDPATGGPDFDPATDVDSVTDVPAPALVMGALEPGDATAVGGSVADADLPATADPGPPVGLTGPEPGEVDLDTADTSLLGLVDRLAAVLERSDLLEIEVQAGSTALILRRPEALAQVVAVGGTGGAAGTAQGVGLGPSASPAHGAAPEAERASVKAPLTGIWYSAPTPGSAPFVQVGGEVGVGQVIGLIEAMKLFNEIKSDVAGRIVRVAVENGQLVKARQPLIEVEPL